MEEVAVEIEPSIKAHSKQMNEIFSVLNSGENGLSTEEVMWF